MRAAAPALCLALALAGCQPPSSLVSQAFPEDAALALDPGAYASLADRLIARFGGRYRHAQAEAMLRQTLGELLAGLPANNYPREVIILDSPAYNAASLPGGQLFITRGALALINDRAELAASLAHELGHVALAHGVQRAREQIRARAESMRVAENTGHSDALAVTVGAHLLSLAFYSKARELEADRFATQLLARTGFDPAASLRILQSLKRVSPSDASALTSHPVWAERIAAVEKLLPARRSEGRRDRTAYLTAVNGLKFGARQQLAIVPASDFASLYARLPATGQNLLLALNARTSVEGLAGNTTLKIVR